MSEGFSASTTVTKKGIMDEEEVEGEARRVRVERSPAAKFQRKRSVSGEIPRNKERDAGIGLGCGSGRSSPSLVKRRGVPSGERIPPGRRGRGRRQGAGFWSRTGSVETWGEVQLEIGVSGRETGDGTAQPHRRWPMQGGAGLEGERPGVFAPDPSGVDGACG